MARRDTPEKLHGWHDVIGIVMLAAAAISALALWSFDPRDLSFNTATPNATTHNYIGTVGAYSPNTCWQVNSTSGHHVHLEFANVQNYSCYRNLAAGSVISQTEYMGYLGGAFATARNKPCPAGA